MHESKVEYLFLLSVKVEYIAQGGESMCLPLLNKIIRDYEVSKSSLDDSSAIQNYQKFGSLFKILVTSAVVNW